jgi:hypothetical protein
MINPGIILPILEEWRAAHQDVIDSDMTKICDENHARWKRLSIAEDELMKIARTVLEGPDPE